MSASKQGDKYWYGCRVKGCPRKMQVVLNIDSLTEVTILLGNKPHVHNEAGDEGRILKNPGVHPDSKQKIIELESLGVKPKAILYRLHELNLPEPTMQQLNNFLKNHRSKQAGIEGPSSTLCLNDLKDWAQTRASMPDDPDQVFVPAAEFIALPRKIFRMFVTTKRLLGLTRNTQHILADATYKLDYEGFPVLTVGTTDRHRSFHPFGLALTTDEQEADFAFMFKAIKDACALMDIDYRPTTLIADNAPAISNGFASVFSLERPGSITF